MSGEAPGPPGPPPITKLSDEDIARIIRGLQFIQSNDNDYSKNDKRHWKTSDIGYFWPDMPISYGAGRVVDYDGSRYFRDVNAFVAQIEDSIPYYTPEVVRNNIQNCLKGQAFTWYSDIISATTKKLLRNDSSLDCSGWRDTLRENFKLNGAQAMDRISSDKTRFTIYMLKQGASLVTWFTDMISLATDAEFAREDQKLRFVYYKMDPELRDRVPQLTDTHTVQTYLNALRTAEDSIREAVRAQDRRIASELRSQGWRNPQPQSSYRDRHWNKNTQPRSTPYIPPELPAHKAITAPETGNDTSASSSSKSPGFAQYIPQAFKKPDTPSAVDNGDKTKPRPL
jgi:hypothetical protein